MNERSDSSRCSSVFIARLNYRGNKKVVEVSRDAPLLPACITWHKGLQIDVGEELFDIESVYFSVGSNRLEIYTEEKEYGDDWTDEMALLWEKDGWKVR